MNSLITSTEIETVSKNLPTNKSAGHGGFTDKFYQTFREELKLIFLKLFQKVTGKEKCPNSFHEGTIIQNQTKIYYHKRKFEANNND